METHQHVLRKGMWSFTNKSYCCELAPLFAHPLTNGPVPKPLMPHLVSLSLMMMCFVKIDTPRHLGNFNDVDERTFWVLDLTCCLLSGKCATGFSWLGWATLSSYTIFRSCSRHRVIQFLFKKGYRVHIFLQCILCRLP